MAVYLAFIALFICALELFVVLMLCAAGELTMQRRPSTNLTYFHQSWRNHSIFPICNKLHIYDIDNINISWFEESRLFSSWLKDESMFCGKFKQPTLSSLFGWKSKTRYILQSHELSQLKQYRTIHSTHSSQQ